MKLHKRTLLPRRKRKGKENKAKVEIGMSRLLSYLLECVHVSAQLTLSIFIIRRENIRCCCTCIECLF